MLPVTSTFTGHLKTAEAIYDGPANNLVGVETFSGSKDNLSPQHAVLLGMSGAGKSVTVCDLLSQTEGYHLISSFKQRERVVIIDPAGTYYLSPLLSFTEAKELHVQQAELATLAFLERNPKDFDNPDLLKLIFRKAAFNQAQDDRIREAVEFRSKQLHQKAEIGRIDILATREAEVLVAVTGQVIRSGIFQDKAFTEAFPFTLRLRLIRNPNMALNGRFPTAVGDFKYEINH